MYQGLGGLVPKNFVRTPPAKFLRMGLHMHKQVDNSEEIMPSNICISCP